MDSNLNLSANAQTLLTTLGATGRAVRLASQAGGLAELTLQWERHVEETEERLFPSLVALGPAADGPVGFCLAEHAELGARLAGLTSGRPAAEWLWEAEILIGRLIHHVFLEARPLQPLLDRTAARRSTKGADQHVEGKEKG